jgi:transcriptional regulator with XRE-family HTH domain
MAARNSNMDRDAVLFAFHRQCERPTASEIIEWTERYPQFADDIRAHAAVRLDRAPEHEGIELEPDQTLLARGRSRALNAVYHARQEADAGQGTSAATWQQMLGAKGLTVPQLARQINIDRMVLAELAAGRMRPPIGVRLADALPEALDVSIASLNTAVEQLIAAPRLGHAKADHAPTIHIRSYEEIIRASNMPDALKRYWLGED